MIIVPANTLAAGGFSVANSCRFNRGDSAKMSKTLGTATLNTKWTVNTWFKLGGDGLGVNYVLWTVRNGTSGPYVNLNFDTSDRIMIYGPDKDGNNDFNYVTNRKFRDVGAWYCITIAFDSTLSAAGDRLRIYVNGVEETSFATETHPAQNQIYVANYTGYTFVVGARTDDSEFFSGYQAEFCMIDGQQLTPTSFGEFDEDSPTIFKPINVSGLTFGNNGFYLDFEDSANLGNDANGGTDLTESNLAAADQATDTPTNNFCTLNPLDRRIGGTGPTFAEGNNMWTASSNSSSNGGVRGSLGVSSGKYYFEVKAVTASMLCCGMQLDSVDARWDANGSVQNQTGFYGIAFNGEKVVAGSSTASVFTALSNNDIIGFAFDLDNNKFFARVNDGAWFASGNPETGANTLGTLASGTYLPAVSSVGWSTASSAQFNFGGSPAFTVSSGNADGNGYGNFEYAVPTGYFALCTKNLAEYG